MITRTLITDIDTAEILRHAVNIDLEHDPDTEEKFFSISSVWWPLQEEVTGYYDSENDIVYEAE